MDNLKFFLIAVAFLFATTSSVIAQINGVNIEVINQSESGSIVKIENTSNGLKSLTVDAKGYFVSNQFDLNLLTQIKIQEDLTTIFEYESDLRTIIHQDNLLRTIIHQDNLLRTIIHQDNLLRFFQEHNFTIGENITLVKLSKFLIQTDELVTAIIDILDLENGAELLIALLIESDIWIEESLSLVPQSFESYELFNSDYDLVKLKVTDSSGEFINVLFFP